MDPSSLHPPLSRSSSSSSSSCLGKRAPVQMQQWRPPLTTHISISHFSRVLYYSINNSSLSPTCSSFFFFVSYRLSVMEVKCSSFSSVLASLLLLLMASSSALEDQGKVLMGIKSSLTDVRNALRDWDIDRNESFCSWGGVSCGNSRLSVVSLNMSSLNLSGEISSAIGELKELLSLDMRGNMMTGQIPDEIGDCDSLMLLDLSNNMLKGELPLSISKLQNLEFLSLRNNQFSGSIPPTFSQIPNLKTLDLAENHLTGEIPLLLYGHQNLQYLGLRQNYLTGILSPKMCQLTGLWYFDIRGNNLSGTIPKNIGNCTSFEILDISYNQITGDIPYNIGFLQVATLSLQGNKLTGSIPAVVGLMQALAVLDLSENKLTGPIPPILGNLSYTGKLYLHGNSLIGKIPPELGNMSRLSYLQLNDNQLTGGIPAELGKLGQLFSLNLANNHLEGRIPNEISSCSALNQLDVYGNLLSGSIPPSFQTLGSLTYLNLSWNNFSGSIPNAFGRILNLDTLDLSGNILSGPIPPSIGDLEHLLILNFSRNDLIGSVPTEFGNLRSIQIIDLAFNNLSGRIPGELKKLQNIASLILNNNNLQGEIPTQLTSCVSLLSLNFSYNNLSGVVPPSETFWKFSEASFFGNPFLCGNWIGSICTPYMPKSKAIFSRLLVTCVAFGLTTLLLMLVLVLCKSNNRGKKVSNGCSGTSLQHSSGTPSLVILHMDMAVHSYEEIMRMTENLSEKYVIGYGASSTVYKCVLKNSHPIAIKRLYMQCPHDFSEFETELETTASIKHRNLVRLHGYSLSPFGNLLFYDYMENGSLWDLLHHGRSKKVTLDWEMRLKVAVGAAQGLAYLHHDCNPRIIHRDVKSSNILLDGNMEAHLSDFGIAKRIPATKTHASTYVLGTIGYIDPEYARTSRVTEKSDVYSFGIVLLELLTGKKPVDDELNLHQLILSKMDNNTIMEAVDPEVSLTCVDLSHVKKMFQLALMCTRRHASERPTMHEVAKVLSSLTPPPCAKPPCSPQLKPLDYTRFFIRNKEEEGEDDGVDRGFRSSSDAHWIVEFKEAISINNTFM